MDHAAAEIVYLRHALRETTLLFIPAVLLFGWALGVFMTHLILPGVYAFLSLTIGVLVGSALMAIYAFRQLLHRRTFRLALKDLKD